MKKNHGVRALKTNSGSRVCRKIRGAPHVALAGGTLPGARYLLFFPGVKTLGLIVTDLTLIETNEGLQTALDRKLLLVREAARRQWDKRFAGADPSDACVRIRVAAIHPPAKALSETRGSGPVKSSRKSKQGSKMGLPRFAH